MRVGVIGAGVSGLVVADLLRDVHEVTVLEANDYAGGHTRTVRVDGPDESHDVDTGFIVFNDRNYPMFTRWIERLGVASGRTSMSFSVSDQDGSFEFSSGSVSGVFAVRPHLWDLRFHRAVADVLRCQRAARGLAASGHSDLSLGEWLEAEGFSRMFIDKIVVPMAAAVWSADPSQMWTFPALTMARFFDNHGMLKIHNRPKWSTIGEGSHTYVRAVAARLGRRLRLATPVASVSRSDSEVTVTLRDGTVLTFDQLVVATHSDQALQLLADPTPDEVSVLSAIPYTTSEVVLHSDTRLLPRRRAAWASWNYHLLDPAPAGSTVTYDMTRLQRLPTTTRYLVTLNRTGSIDPNRVIDTFHYAHPVFTKAAAGAQAAYEMISGHQRTHFCGAYWGMGFHEDGVVSGARVARALGARPL